MKIACRFSVLLLISIATVSSLEAQWLKYPTAGVPRLPNGSPNLEAPTPRTLDGKPDFSGIWEPERNRPCPPGGCPDMEIPQEFINIGFSLRDGAPYQPWAAQAKRARTGENGKDDPVSQCLPGGVVKLHTTPQLRKIIQIQGLLVTLNEMEGQYRQIFIDGRPLPDINKPSFNGYSVGKWEGDTLVVETTGFPDGMWLDRSGSPMTDAAKITERFRRINYGTMQIDVTIDDAKAYTRPWTIKLTQHIVLDTELIEYICTENERDAGHMIGK
jgi:hypothetical protein